MMDRIASIEIFKYSIPFLKPLLLFSSKLQKREGFIIRVRYKEAPCRYAEVAPLQDISKENMDDAYIQLVNVCELLKKNEQFEIDKLYPSVLFGLLSINNFYSKEFTIPYSGLLYHEQKVHKFKPTLNTYKLKISKLSVDEAISVVKQLKSRFKELKLRLDVNQVWSLQDALYFLDKFSPDDFEYIEEPCKTISDTKEIMKRTNHKIAIDESLAYWKIKELIKYPNIEALIIKPMLTNFLKYIKCKIPLVFSSTFESSIGLLNTARLSTIYSRKLPGLDTLKFLKCDVLKEPIQFGSEMSFSLPINLNEAILKLCHRV